MCVICWKGEIHWENSIMIQLQTRIHKEQLNKMLSLGVAGSVSDYHQGMSLDAMFKHKLPLSGAFTEAVFGQDKNK